MNLIRGLPLTLRLGIEGIGGKSKKAQIPLLKHLIKRRVGLPHLLMKN